MQEQIKVKRRGPGRPKKKGRPCISVSKKKHGIYLKLNNKLLNKLRKNLEKNEITINEQVEKALEMYFSIGKSLETYLSNSNKKTS